MNNSDQNLIFGYTLFELLKYIVCTIIVLYLCFMAFQILAFGGFAYYFSRQRGGTLSPISPLN
jgi:hypothetical protein